MRKLCAFCCCHPTHLAPSLHQVRNEPKQTKPHKPMKHNLLSFGFFTLTLADTLALSQITLTLPEALCILALHLWSTLLFWRSLLS